MKNTKLILILAAVIMVGSLPMATQAEEESMNFNLVSMYIKMERVKVTQMEGVRLGRMPLMLIVHSNFIARKSLISVP